MTRNILSEKRVNVRDLSAYAGWRLNGALARDGSLLWGEIIGAGVRDVRGETVATVTYAHNVRGTTVPNGQTLALTTPDGDHYVTVTKTFVCHGGETVGETDTDEVLHHGDPEWHPIA